MAIVDVVVIPVGTEGPSVSKYIADIQKNFKNIKQWVKLIFN
ncbi:DglA [Staphylococcus aureus]|nr:DglA [Staphylococcus aureus]SCT06995.1 DglA [Staphylococcus aureus]